MADAVSARSLIADAERNASRFRARYRVCPATANARHLRLIAANYRRRDCHPDVSTSFADPRAVHSLNATLVRSTRYRFHSLHGQMLTFHGSWEPFRFCIPANVATREQTSEVTLDDIDKVEVLFEVLCFRLLFVSASYTSVEFSKAQLASGSDDEEASWLGTVLVRIAIRTRLCARSRDR